MRLPLAPRPGLFNYIKYKKNFKALDFECGWKLENFLRYIPQIVNCVNFVSNFLDFFVQICQIKSIEKPDITYITGLFLDYMLDFESVRWGFDSLRA
jgi:hypothetical protein